jgi:hypothetical protein
MVSDAKVCGETLTITGNSLLVLLLS